MSLTYEQAKDEMMKMLNDVWGPTGNSMIWPDRAPKDSTEELGLDPWGRTVFFHTEGTQGSLAGADGRKIWDRKGRLIVQVNVVSGEGGVEAYSLASIVVNAFEGKRSPGGVWFKKVVANEIGSVRKWFRINVSVDFEYREVK